MNDQLTATILIAAGLTGAERATLARKLSHAGTKSGDQSIAISATMCMLVDKGIILPGGDAWNGLDTLRAAHRAAMQEAHDLMTEVDELSQAIREAETVSA